MQTTPLHCLMAPLAMAWFLSTVLSSGQEIEDIKGSIKTEDGRLYRDVEVLQRDPHGITFRHAKGIAKIPFSEFSEKIQGKYQYDKDSALKFLKEHASVDRGHENIEVAMHLGNRAVAAQFLPGAYTSLVGMAPITLWGSTMIDALRASEYHPPLWVHPTPSNVPIEMYLWRQLSVRQHLSCATSLAHRRLSGYGDVNRAYRQSSVYPRVAYESVPAIGLGRMPPAIGEGRRSSE